MPWKHAKPSDQPLAMRPIQEPKRIDHWPVLLSAAQIWEMLEGHVPKADDEADKWFVYSTFQYHDAPEVKGKDGVVEQPKNVDGVVRTHFCLAKTARTLFVLEVEVRYIDVVMHSHPDTLRWKFENSEMITGVVTGLEYEAHEDIVEGVSEDAVKQEVIGICARVLGIFLLVKGIVPMRLEDRTSTEKFKESLRMKLDFESAMQRVASSKLRLLTGSGRADAVTKMLQGRNTAQLFLESRQMSERR